VVLNKLVDLFIDYYYITMPTFTDTNGIIWNYTLSGNNATIGDGTTISGNATNQGAGLSGAIIIPSTVTDGTQNYPVTGIHQRTFNNCTGLTSITIPELVTSIGDFSFAHCTGLTSLTIPNKVTSIGTYAFYNLNVPSVTVGTSVTSIGASAFQNCSKLTSINIPISVTSIGVDAFNSTPSNLNVAMNTKTIGGTTYTSPTAPGPDIAFFGNPSVTLVLPPTMTITSTTPGVTSGSTTNNTSIALTFNSSVSTSNFVVGDISVTNGSLLSSFAGSGSVYTATFTPTNQGPCTINVAANKFTDAAGNNNTASNTFNWTFDNVSPSMTITSTTTGVTSGSTTNNAFIALTFTSTEVTTNFVVGDITVTNGALSNFAGSGAVYNAIFTPANEGACTINVLQGAYTDAATNLNNLATQFNWTFSTGWNIDMFANHIIKSYVKDFIDVSGSVILRQNSNLYISGNAETAGNVSLNRLFVTADASFNRRIFVGGDVSMNGSLFINGDLSMNGSVTKCNLNNNSIPKSAFASTVPDGPDYNTSRIVYGQTFQANDDVSMNGATIAANNVTASGNIIFGDGTVMNAYDNNISTTNPPAFKPSTFTALDICGNLVAGSYASSSDYRIKTNVVELDETYTVDKLRPVKYYQTQINREKYGLIAHELQEHYPDLVVGEKDGAELQRVNYTGLIAILINDIKRLKRELEVLELQQ